MAHTIQLSDNLYETLVQQAQVRGETPEELLWNWLTDLQSQTTAVNDGQPDSASDTMHGEYDPTKDPLAPFLGAFEATEPDVVREHDSFLGEAYADSHCDEQ